jgi:hypothetical protein
MDSHFIGQLFSSWQIILVCAGLMFLLPLLFYAASLRPRRMPRLPARKPRKPKPVRMKRAKEAEPVEEREEDEEKDEVEYKERE